MRIKAKLHQLAHLQIPLDAIVSATDNFSDANLIGEDAFGMEYRGPLLRSGQLVDIVARRLDETKGLGKKNFWTEVSMLSKLEHQNIVSIVGFCEEDGEKIIIYKHDSTGGDLYDHLTDPSLMTWMRRLQICVGVARALSYIHYDEGRDFSVIHCDITSSKILLNDRWEPKLSGFELSISQTAAERGRPCQLPKDDIWFTRGYVDPTYSKTGIVSHKSDMFSLGVVLFEVLCGKGTKPLKGVDEIYLYQSAKTHFEEETLLYNLVTPGLRNQMGPESFNIFSKTAYSCLNKQPSERPSIDQIVIQLDKALESQRIYENRFAHLRVPLEEIVSATNNFSDANFLRKDGFIKEYKGELLFSGQWIDIVARRLDETEVQRDTEFWMEVSMLSTLEHQNIVSIVGFCEEDGQKIVIHKHESTRGHLYHHLSDPALTWMQRLEICVGVGHALGYIHYDEGRDFSVIHRDITSHSILLDDRWEPKLSGFELSISQPVAERGRPFQVPDDYKIWSRRGCCDPTYLETRSVSHKSDMFSLGVVLFQVLCGKGTTLVKEDDVMYLYQLAKSQYREGRVYDLVHPGLRKQMGPESFKIYSETAYSCLNEQSAERPSIDQIVIQLEKALESQRIYENRFAHLQIPLEEIVSATNNFSDANLIKSDHFGKEYKGQLLRSGQLIDFVARRLDNTEGKGKEWFWMEVSMLATLEHQNIVSIMGFCDENGEKIVINKYESTRGNLYQYLRHPTLLTWKRRLEICVGVAWALSYIHYNEGRDFSVIHLDIKSAKILLDGQWEPKLSGFELSMTQAAIERNRPFRVPDDDDIWYTPGCCDPTYLETRSVSHKSDMFSLGVVLFEVLCGKATEDVKGDDEMYLYQSAKSHFEGETLYDLVTPGLRNQMGPESFNIFSKTAYECLKAEPSERPSIDQIVTQLEKALESQRIYENRFTHLRIPLEEIVSATDNFSAANFIRQDGFVKEYKGRLLRSGQWIDMVAQRLDETDEQRDTEFWMELSMLSRLEHQNIVSIIGFCDENGEKIIINKHESTRGALNDHLTDPRLTWMLRLEICVSVARALSYTHYDEGRDFSIIHRDITSYNILLGDRWEPKLSRFELSISQTAAQRDLPCQVPDDDIWGADGYMDPTYLETGIVSHKSDMFSLGVVLFELLCGKGTEQVTEEDEMYLYELAISHYEEGRLYDLVHPGLRKQMGSESLDIFLETAYSCLNEQPSERPNIDQIVIQLDKALESQRIYENQYYEQFAHLRIPLEEIVSTTDNFSDANFIGGDGFGREYIGQLLRSGQWIDIVARRLDNTEGKGNEWFWMEISMLATLEHQNIVSIMGFCDENGEKIIINKHDESTHGNLYQHLRDPSLMTWMRRLQICVGVARALSYIHYDEGRDFSIIHRDIKSAKILLDGQWEPKLSGFELSMTRAAIERNRPCQVPDDDIWATPVCCDPTYLKTGSVSHKSDMFSFGVVLIDLLCSKGTIVVKEDEMYLYESAISHYREGRLYDLVHPVLWKQMGPESFKIISETAYSCLNDQPSERPSIDQIVIQLEKALESQRIYENRFAHLRIPLEEIVSATNNFSDANFIKEDGFIKEYKGQFLWSGQWIDIVARRFLDEKNGQRDIEFWMEVSILSRLEHQNIVSIVGICDENGEKIVINKHESTHGELDDHLRDPSLTWMLRLEICVGVARALSYIHYDEGRDFSVIHRGITSSSILLDDRWEPKISGFEVSISQPAAERGRPCQVPDDDIWVIPGCCDPTYLETGIVSHKSDIFSFGVVLIEVLCGIGTETVKEDERFLYQLAKSHYEEKKINGLVKLGLWKQMGPQSFTIFSDLAYRCLKAEPSERPSIDQIVLELEKALESQREHDEYFAHLRIPLMKIVSATDNFSDANLIKGSELGKAYRGKLLWSEQVLIDIVAQRFDPEDRDQDVEFWKEISMLSTLEHKNVISMVGFCVEYGKIIIYKHEAKGSLEAFLRDPTLTWMRRLQICVGVAHALSYIYYDEGRDFSIIHCDIRSSKILLDDNWEAKLSGFELSLKLTEAQRYDLFLTGVCGTHGYRDPTYVKSGSVTHKSDIYSLGVVLFEVLSEKKAVMVDHEDNRLLALFAKSQYEGGKLDAMIDPDLRKQMDPQSLQIFSDIAYSCLKEQRLQRPNIGVVVMELEKALGSQWKHEKSLILKASVEGTSSKNLIKGKDLKYLEIPLIDIETATGDFKRNIIGSGTFGEVYKAELDHFDNESYLPLEEKSIGERPKKRSTVAIKRIKIRKDQQGKQGFLAEIEMLSNCKHPNIVSLLGFCKEDSHMILVYEYASNGSLQAYMGSTGKYLTWVQRLKISIEIAHGLNYLHTNIGDARRIIHRDIKSDNILLGENFEAKIADFGLSKFRPANQIVNTIDTMTYAGTDFYMDPEYSEGGKFSNKVDIYSFGVVLLEMLSGRFANDPVYVNENANGIAPVARRHFNDRTIKQMVDRRLMEEAHESSFARTKGPNQYALHAFLDIAHQCVASQAERPTTDIIVKKLEEALSFQEGTLKHLQIPLIDILSATKNFDKTYLIGPQYDEVYEAELDHFDSKSFLSFVKKSKSELPKKRNTLAIKRIFTREDQQGEKVFHEKVEMLSSYKHPNIVSLLGFCEEDGHMILVYEHSSKGTLDDYLGSTRNLTNLPWVQRIKICIDVARGMNYLHSEVYEELRMKHFEIKSGNILLGYNWEAKIAGFELSKIHPQDQQVHLDYKYDITGKLKNDTHIYSFGVVLFEILSGRFANDPIYTKENSNGIVPIACRHFNERTIKKMVDPTLMEETNEHTLKKGPVEDSLDAFSKVAYQCVTEHPLAEFIVKKLEEALYFQENTKDHLKISLVDIERATENFSKNNLIGRSGFGEVYKGELTHSAAADNGRNTWAVKRLDKKFGQGTQAFKKELQTLLEYRHENIIGIVGYCFEKGENIIVYEYASRGSLDKHLGNNGLTWMKRLQICIDIASGLEFLHAGGVTQEVLIHSDMKPHNILLNDDWRAKVSDFGLITPNKDKDISIGFHVGSWGYTDPLYLESGRLTKEADIYSFGVVLSEILSGRLVLEYINGELQNHIGTFERHYEEGKLDEIVFEGIKEQIATLSLTTFLKVVYQCLHHKREERPTTSEVLLRLKQALEFQEDYDIWEPKLPKDYKKIIDRSNSPGIYSTEKKKDLYDMLSKGILLHQGQLLFSLGSNGEKNELISAKKFSYKQHRSRRWQSLPESRFDKLAKMLDITNLQIQLKIKPQFLSPGVDYGVHLVFRFCGPRKSVAKRMYVNLKYKKGSETLHTYFATWREDGWMVIELCRFLNHKEDTDFKFLLESFSRCYCESHDIYIEGIEFKAIDNVKHDEIKESEDVQQPLIKSDLNRDQVQRISAKFEEELKRIKHYDEIEKFSLNKVSKMKHYMLSAKESLYQSSDVKLFNLIPSTESRFQEVIELQRQQVFGIKCKILSQRLSPDTIYACYLVFKLSVNCHGLHCPVIVRSLLQHKNKEKRIIYFRSPSPCNVNDTDRVPEEREDGWKEVNVWQFNSSNELQNDCVSVSLKLISYEGTMSGLIVSSLEFRPR